VRGSVNRDIPKGLQEIIEERAGKHPFTIAAVLPTLRPVTAQQGLPQAHVAFTEPSAFGQIPPVKRPARKIGAPRCIRVETIPFPNMLG